jgi:hypothetical protein
VSENRYFKHKNEHLENGERNLEHKHHRLEPEDRSLLTKKHRLEGEENKLDHKRKSLLSEDDKLEPALESKNEDLPVRWIGSYFTKAKFSHARTRLLGLKVNTSCATTRSSQRQAELSHTCEERQGA